MAAGLYFLKLGLNYLKEEKFNNQLTDSQKWRYVQLNMLAKELNAGGSFIRHGSDLTIEDIAWDLHLDPVQLQADLEALKGAGLIRVNGHGPLLVRFKKEQDARPVTDRMADYRSRKTEQIQDGYKSVTKCNTESESESDIDIESERNYVSEDSQSVSDLTDKHSQIETKRNICSIAGIPPKYSEQLLKNGQITFEDLISELARNYSRKEKIKNPGLITGMNLTKQPPEKAAADWYDPACWTRSIPDQVRDKITVFSQGGQSKFNNYVDVAIRIKDGKRFRKMLGRDG